MYSFHTTSEDLWTTIMMFLSLSGRSDTIVLATEGGSVCVCVWRDLLRWLAERWAGKALRQWHRQPFVRQGACRRRWTTLIKADASGSGDRLTKQLTTSRTNTQKPGISFKQTCSQNIPYFTSRVTTTTVSKTLQQTYRSSTLRDFFFLQYTYNVTVYVVNITVFLHATSLFGFKRQYDPITFGPDS